jgi:hypothetical protein
MNYSGITCGIRELLRRCTKLLHFFKSESRECPIATGPVTPIKAAGSPLAI